MAQTETTAQMNIGRRCMRGVLTLVMLCSGVLVAVGAITPGPAGATGVWSAPTNIAGFGQAISCASATFCVALDDAGDAFTYNGSTWSGPTLVDNTSFLYNVSCPTSSFCMAVDDAGNAFSFNGSSWSTGTQIATDYVAAVSCPTISFCVAVSDSNVSTFNGSSWSLAATIDNPHIMFAVSCPSVSFCVATDDAGNALTYDGTTWSSPSNIDSHPLLVTCATASYCVANDYFGNVVTYTSGSWSAPTSINGGLSAMSCTDNVASAGNTFCAAVDQVGNALTFTGGAWSSATSIDTQYLTSVSCPTEAFCAATDAAGNVLTYTNNPAAPTLVVPSEIVPLQAAVTPPFDAGWDVTITNTSTVPAHNVIIYLTPAARLDLTGMAKYQESCHPFLGNTEYCTIGTIPAGGPSATVTFHVLVGTAGFGNGDQVFASAQVTSSDASTPPTIQFDPVTTEIVTNKVIAVLVPKIKLSNTSAPLSTSNPVKVTLQLPAKVLRSTLAASVRVPRATRASSKKGSPPPLAVVLDNALPPSADTQLCPPPSSVSCYSQLAVVTGNFGSYKDQTNPVSAVTTFFVGLVRADTTLWMDKGNGTTVHLNRCTKTGKAYNTPCYSKMKKAGAVGKQVAVYTILFVGTDPRFGLRG